MSDDAWTMLLMLFFALFGIFVSAMITLTAWHFLNPIGFWQSLAMLVVSIVMMVGLTFAFTFGIAFLFIAIGEVFL